MVLGLATFGCGTAAPSPAPTVEPQRDPVSARAPTLAPTTAAQPAAPIVEAPAPLTLAGDTADIRSALAKSYIGWTSTPGRIAVRRRGPVRLVPEGPDLGLADEHAFPSSQRLGVLVDGPRPLVMTEHDGIRLLLFVRHDDATPVVVADAPLRRRPTDAIPDPPRRGRVVLHPGAWVKVEASTPTAVRVAYHDGNVTRRGWVEPDRLGTVVMFDRPSPDQAKAKAKAKADDDDDTWWTSKRATTLRVTADGNVLERLDAEEVVRALAPARGGRRLVQYTPRCNRDLSVIGFVTTRDFHQPNYGHAYGCGYGTSSPAREWGDALDLPRVELAAGTFLTDAASTRLVGCVAKASKVADRGDGTYVVATIWGPLTVRPAPTELVGACASED